MLFIYNYWKHPKTKRFFIFSEDTDQQHRAVMGKTHMGSFFNDLLNYQVEIEILVTTEDWRWEPLEYEVVT